ncbi:MAG: hypothetical protein K2X00_08395 [Nitrospiraceae bacterium]|nr:hypothetical protein [Nitrospiraceae bacterium]OQW65721.1 MAG: hypothetical protein BVN29_08860 [Nitrospira sp. ST-bin5]
MSDEQKDVFDYSMSDDFVSETRLVPYRTGFRSRHCGGKLPLGKVNALNDRDFKRYIQNGCRFLDPEQDLRVQLAEQREASCEQSRQIKQLQEAVRRTQIQIDQLRSLLPKALQAPVSDPSTAGAGSHPVRGLNVAKR